MFSRPDRQFAHAMASLLDYDNAPRCQILAGLLKHCGESFNYVRCACIVQAKENDTHELVSDGG